MTFLRPMTRADLSRLYGDEASCRAALISLRWPDGFRCPTCGGNRATAIATRSLVACSTCDRQTSVTVDTDLHRHHLPLVSWFAAVYLATTTPGANTTRLMREIPVSRPGAAEVLITRLRQAMARSLAAPLTGVVEADEAFFGQKQHRNTVEVLAEARSDGRIRMGVIAGQTMVVLTPFIVSRVEPGSMIRTDGWKGYNGLEKAGFAHERLVHTAGWAERGERSTPYADEAISAAKRWLLATYNKPPAAANLDAYLAEFCFRREYRDPGVAFAALLRGLVAPRGSVTLR